MAELSDRCVLLKNLPRSCTEYSVRELLDLAHGDFCFEDRYKKLHRHVECEDDVRWIVLFHTKQDACDCIKRGAWLCSIQKGNCRVIPDYCSGCIIPDDWITNTTKDESDNDWDMGASVPNVPKTEYDCENLGVDSVSLDNTSRSFVKIKLNRDSRNVHATYNSYDKSNHKDSMQFKAQESDNISGYQDTMCMTHMDDCDADSSINLFGSGNLKTNSNDSPKHNRKEGSKPVPKERLSLCEKFGSGTGVKNVKQKFSNELFESEMKIEGLHRDSSDELFGSGTDKDVNGHSSSELYGKRTITDNPNILDASVISLDMFGGGREKVDEEMNQISEEHTENTSKADKQVISNATGNSATVKVKCNVQTSVDDNLSQTDTKQTPNNNQDRHSTHCTIPYTQQQWYNQDVLPQVFPYMPLGPQGYNMPAPLQHENRSQNYLRYPMYQYMPYMVPSSKIEGNEQTETQQMPQVRYVPVYMPYPGTSPGVLQPDKQSIDDYVHTHRDTTHFTGQAFPNSSSKVPQLNSDNKTLTNKIAATDTEVTKQNVCDTPYGRNPQYATTTERHNSKYQTVAIEGDAKVRETDDVTNPYLIPRNFDYSDENIYEEIDDDKWKTNKPMLKPDPPQRVPCKADKVTRHARDTTNQCNLTKAHASIYQSTKPSEAPPPPELIPPPRSRNAVPKQPSVGLQTHTRRFDEDSAESCLETHKHELKKGCRRILVKGVSASTSEDLLELLFENRRKTGGGEIENIVLNEKKGEAIIEFKRIEDALEVLRRADLGIKISLNGNELIVSEYRPPALDPLKVFVRNIAETTTTECIANFISVLSGLETTDVVSGETPGTAMVCFETPPDINRLRNGCEEHRCEGKHWTILPVEISCNLRVTGLKPHTSADLLCLYFENTKHSQGGEVENVTFREEESDCIVTFVHPEDAERVSKNNTHTLKGHPLALSLYYPCLDLDEDFIVKIPPAIQLDELDDYTLKFLQNSRKYKLDLENTISSKHGTVIWPSANSENQNIQISCNVGIKDKKARNKVCGWTENCASVIRNICQKLTVERSKNMAVEVWTELKTRLLEIEVSHPESIAVFLENSDCVVVTAGETSQVRAISAQIHSIVTDIENALEIEGQIITKKMKLKTYQMALVRSSRLETTLKKSSVEFTIDNDLREVTCKGKQKDVDDTLSKLNGKLKAFANRPVPGMNKQAKDLLFRKETRDYIKKKMRKEKVIGVWDVARDTGLVMYSKNERDLNTAIDIVKSSLVIDIIKLDVGKRDILENPEGKSKILEFEDNLQGCVSFELLSDEFRYVCLDYLHQEIKDEITKLFDLHSVISEFLPTEPGIFSYIIKYQRREIEGIEMQYKRLSVIIETVDNSTKPGFKVNGKRDGCKLAVNRLRTIIDAVAHKDHTVSWPGFDKFIQGSEGRDVIRNIEFDQKCMMKVSSDALSGGFEKTTESPSASSASPERTERRESSGNFLKEVIIGSLATEDVDVIVNSTNRSLDLSVGAISRTLLKVGGDKLKTECQIKYPDGIKPGEIAITSGGGMNCKTLYHGLLTKWDGGQGHAERVMESFVKNCLSTANTNQHTSIAFPALGTGALGFPADVVAQMMFDIVDAFETDNPSSSLRNVRFVVWPDDKPTVKAFEELQSRCVRRRKSGLPMRSRHSFHHSPTADNLIIKSKGYNTTIGQVSVSIVHEDLIKSTAGAIVNSTTDDLNLNSGYLSKAILLAAGSAIQTEAHAQRGRFSSEGLVVTSPGRLLCQKIIHIRARNSLSGWAETIKKCLAVVENLGLNSVTFPALGTGGKGVQPDCMAKTMVEAFKGYVKSSSFQQCLKTIQIVIYETKMLEPFISEVKSTLDPSRRKSMLPEWRFWERKPHVETAPSVTIHVYAHSTYCIDSVIKRVEDIRQENNLSVPKHVYEHMDDTHKSDLQRIGYSCGVKVVLIKSRVKVMGYAKAVTAATKQAQHYIEGISNDIKHGLANSAVKLPSNWSKMSLSDPTKIVLLMAGDPDYVTVSQKFATESAVPVRNIVKIERIQNPTLYTQYIGKKTQMENSNSSRRNVEQILWHGTKSTAVDNINCKGFDRNYNSGSSHGVGVYFAKKAQMSAQGYCTPDSFGHKHIYLAHVLTGDYCVGQGGIRVPPTKSISPLVTYDSTTDNVQAPNFFVIFHDTQAYPSFLITFK